MTDKVININIDNSNLKRHNNNNNDDCFDVCCEKFCLCIGITISVLFAVAGA
jgi:hypothetical protein